MVPPERVSALVWSGYRVRCSARCAVVNRWTVPGGEIEQSQCQFEIGTKLRHFPRKSERLRLAKRGRFSIVKSGFPTIPADGNGTVSRLKSPRANAEALLG